MPEITEGRHAGEFLHSEANGALSRDAIVLAAGNNLAAGAVLGRLAKDTVAAAKASGTGNGTITMAETPLGAAAEVGRYVLTCLSNSAAGSATAAFVGTAGTRGTMSAVTVGTGAQVGVYKVTFIEPAENLGAFSVEAPDGTNVGTGTVGTEFVGGGLTFTISDGETDFASGDQFTVTVAEASAGLGIFSVKSPEGLTLANLTAGEAYTSDHINLTVADGSADWVAGDIIHVDVSGSGKFTALAPAATNGSEIAAGILYAGVDASLADAPAVAVVRCAELNAAELGWPDAITDGQKAVALAQLSAINLIAR